MASQLPVTVTATEDREKEGSYGSWRKQFCRKYAALLDTTRRNTSRSLEAAVSAEGRQISCAKGSTYC